MTGIAAAASVAPTLNSTLALSAVICPSSSVMNAPTAMIVAPLMKSAAATIPPPRAIAASRSPPQFATSAAATVPENHSRHTAAIAAIWAPAR